MSEIPQTIQFSSIDRKGRARSVYSGINELAQSILDKGLIQPLVISVNGSPDSFVLNAGGRRSEALAQLQEAGQWDGVLHHGLTCETDPLRPGFVLKSEPPTELSNVLTELGENLDREDMPWKDEMDLIVRAAKLVRQEQYAKGHMIIMRDLGHVLGCGYHDLQAAEQVYDDVKANPKDYESCTSIRAAYQILIKKTRDALQAEATSRIRNQSVVTPRPLDPQPNGLVESEVKETTQLVCLSDRFFHQSGIDLLASGNFRFDHIVCDPDFAISEEVLDSKGTGNYASGVAQSSPSQSLSDLERFLAAAFPVTSGFCVFFYDLDHHEKIKSMATAIGWAVQRWPIIWHKTDYRSNGAPAYNFCKNLEYAMVCRKPGAVLAKSPQMSSIVSVPSGSVVDSLGHPFCKPRDLWKFIYSAVASPGQTVFDPFVGRGSSVLAALDLGLVPYGTEIQESHYNGLLTNLQTYYTNRLGPNVRFL